jgi:hypothetical protein
MDKITLSTNLVNAILAYLGKRPYEESYQLIEAIQKEGKEYIQQQQKDTGDGDSAGS